MKEGESAKIFSIFARAPSQDVQKCSHKMANRGWTRRIRESLDRHKFICFGLVCLTYVQTGAKLLHKSPSVLFFQDIEVFKAKITFILGAVKFLFYFFLLFRFSFLCWEVLKKKTVVKTLQVCIYLSGVVQFRRCRQACSFFNAHFITKNGCSYSRERTVPPKFEGEEFRYSFVICVV